MCWLRESYVGPSRALIQKCLLTRVLKSCRMNLPWIFASSKKTTRQAQKETLFRKSRHFKRKQAWWLRQFLQGWTLVCGKPLGLSLGEVIRSENKGLMRPKISVQMNSTGYLQARIAGVPGPLPWKIDTSMSAPLGRQHENRNRPPVPWESLGNFKTLCKQRYY